MAFIGKTYKYVKDENFEDFIESLGLPAERTEGLKNFRPDLQLKKDGDTYTLVMNTTERHFKSGVEFDDTTPEGNEPNKSTFTVDGNTVTQVQKFPDGRSLIFKREYSGDELVLTITTSFWDGTAKRYYKAV